MSIIRYQKGPRLSRAVSHNGTMYFSGLTASDRSGDVQAQTREILAKADQLLAEVGADRSRLLNAMIWLRNISDFTQMNFIWEAWIDSGHPPARATVESKLASDDILIEIQFTVAE